MRTHFEGEDEHSRALYEIQSLIVHVLKFPLFPIPSSTPYSHVASSSSSSHSSVMRHLCTTLLSSQVSLASFASLFLGISLALMFFGPLAFIIGFVLFPWVTTFVFLFHTALLVSFLSRLGRKLLCSSSMLRNIPCEWPLVWNVFFLCGWFMILSFFRFGFMQRLRQSYKGKYWLKTLRWRGWCCELINLFPFCNTSCLYGFIILLAQNLLFSILRSHHKFVLHVQMHLKKLLNLIFLIIKGRT